MFYLKYRPRTLTELDNTSVKDILYKHLESEKFPHAFIFIGDKGTGKTSAARVFAKSINCLKNKYAKKGGSIEPCNECKNCKSIETSSSVDIVEMDAASNRGIDEIRKLIKDSSFLPMNNRYRVYIIDEAHMITNDAFNALLKTLEEPPSSVIFILATTNIEKVPKTIVSRCSVINFKRAKKEDVLSMLKRILKNENLEINNKVLSLIASHSDNSFRDAAKILEELIIQNKVDYEDAKKFLGILGKQNLLEIIQAKGIKDCLLWIEEFKNAGGDFKTLIEQLLEELRTQLLIKNSIYQDGVDVKLNFTIKELSNLIKLFTKAYNNLKISPIDSLPLEIAVVDFYNKNSK
jgi:DNA polymerase-3 subunit gamma/tau